MNRELHLLEILLHASWVPAMALDCCPCSVIDGWFWDLECTCVEVCRGLQLLDFLCASEFGFRPRTMMVLRGE